MKTRIALNGNDGNWRIGVGESASWTSSVNFSWESVDSFINAHPNRTKFIIASYELRKQLFAFDTIIDEAFPLLTVWIPESLFILDTGGLRLEEGDASIENEALAKACLEDHDFSNDQLVEWKARQTKADYLQQINFLKEEIQQGNLYEVNYCQEFYAEEVKWTSILPAYQALNKISTAPYSVLFESHDWMFASASPERYLQKRGNRLISQPIKGTAARGKTIETDQVLRMELGVSHKDRTENVMIVDLVRNDLSRIATKGSVKVDELFGVYTYPTVHQLISTVSCELKPETPFSEILKATFPMGSMTGAPKVAAMKLAEQTERFARGLYSGTVGYMLPNGDFDLNVMIRTIFCDRKQQTASCGVGGAITIFSDPEQEYEECQTKVGRILETVGTCQW